jgi:sarcosine oxidase/L-pipecolate oxidase
VYAEQPVKINRAANFPTDKKTKKNMSTTKSDILIVGGGIFGVSAAYHLVQKYADTKNITLLDRGAAPSDQAASTDINKIIRADYTSPFYMSLAHEAIDAWSSWPMLRDLYHRTGWIMMDEKGSDVAARIRANFRAGGRPDVSRDRTERDIKEEYRGLFARTEFGEYGSYYANPSAGWAEAGEAVRVMTEEAVRLGVRYEVGEVDGAVLYDDDDAAEARVRGVKTKDGRLFTAEKVLLATGAWTSALMSSVEEALALPEGHRVESQVSAAGVCVAHFRLSDEESRIYRQLPVLIFGAKG